MNDYAVEKSEPKRAKELQVVSEVSRFQTLTVGADNVITELEKRLESVLRELPPSATTGNDIGEMKVGLASVLSAENNKLNYVVEKIESILERLEI